MSPVLLLLVLAFKPAGFVRQKNAIKKVCEPKDLCGRPGRLVVLAAVPLMTSTILCSHGRHDHDLRHPAVWPGHRGYTGQVSLGHAGLFGVGPTPPACCS
jgi:hypothetical protein